MSVENNEKAKDLDNSMPATAEMKAGTLLLDISKALVSLTKTVNELATAAKLDSSYTVTLSDTITDFAE